MKPARFLAPLLLAACRASSGAESVPPAAPPTPAGVEYTVALATQPELAVRFTVSAPASADGTTVFGVDASWGGVDDAADAILDVAASGADGRPLAVEKTSSHEWSVRAPAGERIAASWRVAPNAHQHDSNPRVHYHTLFDAGLLHFIGHLGLLTPLRVDGSLRSRVAFRWVGFAEAGWTVATSFGADPRGFDVEASLDELRHAVYLAAPDLRVHRAPVRGREVTVAIAGHSWPFSDEEFVKDVRAIVETERAFFGDDDFPYYLVSVIPVGEADPHSRSLGGTGLTRSFACFLHPDTPIGASGGSGLGVPHLLAHEMFHHWNGGVAGMEEDEQLVYWFSEGFTEFYARRLLHRAGFGGLEETARSLNEALKEYALSPVVAAPNEKIREGFWSDRELQRLPYLRGDLVAILLDHEIRRRSHGGRSLDDFFREVVAHGREGGKLGTSALLERIASWTDASFAERVRSIVVDGTPVVLDAATFEPCLELGSESLGAYELGFDLDASRAAKEIRGVTPGSAAEDAGLRNGQRLTSVNITYGNPETPVEVGVRDDEGDRKLRWLPQGDRFPVPRVKLRDGAASADCAWL